MRAMENEAFEQAAKMHKDRVFAYATHMLRDPDEGQDVAQEALVRLWTHWSNVDPKGVRMWLMRTVHNLCIDRIRKRKVRGEVDAETRIQIEPDKGPDPGRLAHSTELSRQISDALATLSPEDRAVVVMREIQQLPYDEIAKSIGVPLGTLKARLHRARERLRGKLTRAGVTP